MPRSCSARSRTAVAILFASYLPLAPEHVGSLLVPASLATVLTGFIMLTTRRKAITQVVGYLVLENGIFIIGLLLHEAMPFLVEVGVLLDLLVGIFVMGIVINHISREFQSLDVDRARRRSRNRCWRSPCSCFPSRSRARGWRRDRRGPRPARAARRVRCTSRS